MTNTRLKRVIIEVKLSKELENLLGVLQLCLSCPWPSNLSQYFSLILKNSQQMSIVSSSPHNENPFNIDKTLMEFLKLFSIFDILSMFVVEFFINYFRSMKLVDLTEPTRRTRQSFTSFSLMIMAYLATSNNQ